MTRAEKRSVEWQMANQPMAMGGAAFADMVERANINPAFVAGYEERERDLIFLAEIWVDRGLANVMTFRQFLKQEGEL